MSKSCTPSPSPPPLLPTIEHPPHVHRLLRLIREGTSSHASRASTLLGRYAASCTSSSHDQLDLVKDNQGDRGDDNDKNENKSNAITKERNIEPNEVQNSALIIWDLIGRLVDGGGDGKNDVRDVRDKFSSGSSCSGLFDPTWSTRSNCSMALAAVARCLPWEDRVHFFFEAGTTTKNKEGSGNQMEKGEENQEDFMWLSVHDLAISSECYLEDAKSDGGQSQRQDVKLETKCVTKQQPDVISSRVISTRNPTNQLDIVTKRGRLLLSSSGEKYNWSIRARLQHDLDDHYSESMAYSREQEALHRLDVTAHNDSQNSDGKDKEENHENSSRSIVAKRQKSFLMRRIRLQRLILARRLGLEGILSAPIADLDVSDETMDDNHVNNEEQSSCNPTVASNDSTNSGNPSLRIRRRRVIDAIVNDEDFLSEYFPPLEPKSSTPSSSGASTEQATSEKIMRCKKRRKMFTETSKRGTNATNKKSTRQPPEGIGIRALLVLESNRSPAFQYTGRSIDVNGNPVHEIGIDAYSHKITKSARHRNPQTLLGSELAYRMFDADWTVRHGALLGTLALLRAWKVHDDPLADKQEKDGDPRLYDGDERTSGEIFSGIESPAPMRRQRFGKWPHDILARCVCILALDRFADFSGTAINGNSTANDRNCGKENQRRNDSDRYATEDIASGAIVAPVREVAAQIIAILLEAAPWDVWECTHLLLVQLYTRTLDNNTDADEAGRRGWEIRHGVLLAWKYTCAMSFIQKTSIKRQTYSSSTSNNPVNYCSTYDKIIMQSIQCLRDESDDVRAVSAQVLLQFLRTDENLYNVNIVENCTTSLWKAISEIRGDVSSCASDLLALFAEMLTKDCKTVLLSLEAASSTKDRLRDHTAQSSLGSVLLKLAEFVDFNSSNVRMSCLNALSLVVEPITKTVVNAISKGDEPECSINEQLLYDLAMTLCHLMRKLFETHFTLGFLSEDDLDGFNVEFSVRDKAWMKLLEAFPLIGDALAQHDINYQDVIAEEIVTLTLRYFDIHNIAPKPSDHVEKSCHFPRLSLQRMQDINCTSDGIASENSYCSKLSSASALAQVYKAISESKFTPHRMSFFISSMLLTTIQSPWFDQCEAAYILHTAILSSGDSKYIMDSCDGYFPLLIDSLVDTPICIMLENNHVTSQILRDSNIRSICDKVLASKLNHLMNYPSKCVTENTGSLWETLLNQRGVSFTTLREGTPPLTKMSMRLSASIAGAIISCGRNNLPPKITPLIRSLMTSLKNVDSDTRKRETCRHMSNLVTIMMDDPRFETTRCKVLTNLCNLACETTVGSGPDESNTCQWAKLTLSLIISRSSDHSNLQQFSPLWKRLSVLSDKFESTSNDELSDAIVIINVVSESIPTKSSCLHYILNSFTKAIINVACDGESEDLRSKASLTVVNFCSIDVEMSMKIIIPTILPILGDIQNDIKRTRCCRLLLSMIQEMGISVSPFVIILLPVAMRLMTDPIEECAKFAASTFAILVRVAPLSASSIDEKHDTSQSLISSLNDDMDSTYHVVRHLILGKPLPHCTLPERISNTLSKGGISLRPYQMEGITWLNFLRQVHLNGALCDDMGLGKTLMSLVAVAMSQSIDTKLKETTRSYQGDNKTLIVCPASVVGHWISEINRFFPGNDVFIPFDFTGAVKSRRLNWRDRIEKCNIVVTSYSTLRSDIDLLGSLVWNYCILDEGHLLKNPSTATAKASRRLKALHKLILTGTPIQNSVNDIWATFDFLMPNFLGSEKQFRNDFARPIGKSQSLDASGDDISLGTECLKILHQQVLPFVLRREKSQVIKELPPKIVTDVPCPLSAQQATLYQHMMTQSKTKIAMDSINNCLNGDSDIDGTLKHCSGNDVLSSILQLRLICTHPILHHLLNTKSGNVKSTCDLSSESTNMSSFVRLDCSGKLSVLNDILRHSGIAEAEMTAADNDTSAFMVDMDDDTITMDDEDEMIEGDLPQAKNSNSKCLIFAQFTQSLDVIERFLLEPHIPSLRYLRLDGSVPMNQRNSIVNRFNHDRSVRVLLLTTKVGGLGLNLTGADKVIFLEPDWNPYVDLQAMDRAHRIGQTKTVNVYRLLTSDTIEEKIMQLQRRKKATSDAVVNTENSSMFSMGTDRLLDIFTFSGSNSIGSATSAQADDEKGDDALNYLDDHSNEYASLSVQGFMSGMN